MRAGRPVFKRIFSLIQAILLIAAAQTPVLSAQSSDGSLNYSDLNTLTECEKKLYGGPHSSLPSAERVGALETQVFGETKKGSLSARIASLRNTLTVNVPSLLSPPLAAKMDTSEDKPPASSKPSSSASQSDNDDLPQVAPPIDHAKNALHQALTLYQQGKLNDADIAFKRVLAIDPNNTDANFNLGAIAEGRGDLQNALKYYKAVLKVNPDDNDAQSGVNAVQQKLASASQSASQPDRLPPPAAPSREVLRDRVGQASAAFKRGDYDGSIQILQSVAQQAPNEPDVQYALAQSYKGKGEYMAARTALNQAIALAPENQMYKDALRDLNRTIADGGAYNATGSSGTGTLASNQELGNNSQPAGAITPFTGVGSPSVGWQGTGDQYSGGQYHPAYANRYAGRSTTSRIERAAVGGLAGAAVGALFGGAMSGYGGRGRGAMMGAGMGGLFGLMFGAR